MKKIIVGCTCILSATILYGLRYVTAPLLCIGNSIRGGNADIG